MVTLIGLYRWEHGNIDQLKSIWITQVNTRNTFLKSMWRSKWKENKLERNQHEKQRRIKLNCCRKITMLKNRKLKEVKKK